MIQLQLSFASIAAGFALFAADLATTTGLGHSVSPSVDERTLTKKIIRARAHRSCG
jgi:hypothetical protein